jgi:hypothetical protein
MENYGRSTLRLFTQCRKTGAVLAIAASVALVSTTAFGGSSVGTTVTNSQAVAGGVLIVTPAGAITGSPGCATNTTQMAIVGYDKTLLASALTAQASGKTVDFYGTATCTIWTGMENISILVVH